VEVVHESESCDCWLPGLSVLLGSLHVYMNTENSPSLFIPFSILYLTNLGQLDYYITVDMCKLDVLGR